MGCGISKRVRVSVRALTGDTLILLLCGGLKRTQAKVRGDRMSTGKTTKAAASAPFRAADHLRSDVEIAIYIEEMLVDGDARAVPVALRTVARMRWVGWECSPRRPDSDQETLYRTLSEKGTPASIRSRRFSQSLDCGSRFCRPAARAVSRPKNLACCVVKRIGDGKFAGVAALFDRAATPANEIRARRSRILSRDKHLTMTARGPGE